MEREKQIVLRARRLMQVRSCQVVTLNVLRKNLARQVLL
ncbi:hypothetical protein ACZ87_02505, partial [Candidatus Erwinia dacicola]